MAAGGAVVLAGSGTGTHGAEINATCVGLTIQITRTYKGWCVAVPDWDADDHYSKHPESFMMPTKWIPLEEFLAVFEADI